MSDSVPFDQLHITFFRPDPLDEPTITRARTAIEELQFLEAIREAMRQILDANPRLAFLDFVVSW
jgi:hypothetical protein